MTENEEMTAEELVAMEAEEQARLEAEERARLEHEAMLAAFPDGTVFFDKILGDDSVRWLGACTSDPHTADSMGWLDNHMDADELAVINGRHYLKGYEPAAETPAEYIARREEKIKAGVQTLIDKTAHQKGYDSGVYCASYVGDPDPEFDAQARAFLAWRGRCWRTCYNILDSVIAGTVAPEDVTDDYVLERLPTMEWPEV